MDGDEAAKGNENKQGPSNRNVKTPSNTKVAGAPSSSNARSSSYPNVIPLIDADITPSNNPNVQPLIDPGVPRPSNSKTVSSINPNVLPLLDADVPPSTNTNVGVASTSNVRAPSASNLKAPSGTNVRAPSGTNVRAPSGTNVRAPSGTNVRAPSASNARAPSASNVRAPSATNVKAPSATNVKAPSATNVRAPSASNARAPSATNVRAPSATNIKAPSATNVKAPSATNVKAPTNQNLGVPSTSNVGTSKEAADNAAKKEDTTNATDGTKHSSLASKYLDAFTKSASKSKTRRPEGEKNESVFDNFVDKDKKLIPEKTTSEGNTASYLNLLNIDNFDQSDRKASKTSRKKYSPFDLTPVEAVRNPTSQNIPIAQNTNNTTASVFGTTGQTPVNCPGLAASLLQKRSPFIHDPPHLEERRPRIQSPRTPRDYIINLREDLADFQESHGLPRSRDYSFVSLGLALIQETGRALFSLFQMFTELFPVLAIISLIMRFALDKLIEIFETQETVPKIKKAVIFTLEMIAIILPLWIIVGSILVPLLSLVLSLFKRIFHIRWRKRGCSAKR